MTQPTRNEGFTLIVAIFLLVVLASAGAFMLNISGVQRQTTTFSILGSRAYHATRSGLEWGVHQAVNNTTCPADTFTLTQAGLNNLDVTVSCTSTDHDQAGTTTRVFRISSMADFGNLGDPEYISREMEANVAIEL